MDHILPFASLWGGFAPLYFVSHDNSKIKSR
jgi:hypothetical protein